MDTLPMLKVPGRYARMFSDSPLLSVVYLRFKHIIKGALEQEGLSEQEENLVDPLSKFIITAAHSSEDSHSVLASDWVALDDSLVSEWMEARMSMRSNSQTQHPPTDSDKNKRKKSSPVPKNPRKQRKLVGCLVQEEASKIIQQEIKPHWGIATMPT
mmetsp:Transcript_41290/g.88015  ORF Transcript_41290/g.88015 Transcript_41290/m.88015 type:complete len:157 (+) Transcript_41290:408-878(+)